MLDMVRSPGIINLPSSHFALNSHSSHHTHSHTAAESSSSRSSRSRSRARISPPPPLPESPVTPTTPYHSSSYFPALLPYTSDLPSWPVKRPRSHRPNASVASRPSSSTSTPQTRSGRSSPTLPRPSVALVPDRQNPTRPQTYLASSLLPATPSPAQTHLLQTQRHQHSLSSSSSITNSFLSPPNPATLSSSSSSVTTSTPSTHSTYPSGGKELSRTMSGSGLKRKVVIMGAPSVGKTSLTQQYIAPPTYQEGYFPTIEATSHKTVSYSGQEYDCEIVDSAGQDEYTLFPPKYAVGVHGYLLVYSINSRQSFEMMQTIHDKILDFAGVQKVPCVLVGQKCDLGTDRRVTQAEGEALAKKLHSGFIESSAKDNKNVVKAFEALLAEMQKTFNPAPEKKKAGWFSWGK